MANYAHIINGVVVNAIVADADFVESLPNKVEYKVLTRGGIGWIFDGTNFIAPQPYSSWVLDNNFDWVAPVPQPNNHCLWDDENQNWKSI